MRKKVAVFASIVTVLAGIAVYKVFIEFRSPKVFSLASHNLVKSIELPGNYHEVPNDMPDLHPGSVYFERDLIKSSIGINKAKKMKHEFGRQLNSSSYTILKQLEIDGRQAEVFRWYGDPYTGHGSEPSFNGSVEYAIYFQDPKDRNEAIELSLSFATEAFDLDKAVQSMKLKENLSD